MVEFTPKILPENKKVDKKSKWWLWSVGCCGGCVVFVIIFIVAGYFLVGKDLADEVGNNFWNDEGQNIFEQIEESSTEELKAPKTPEVDPVDTVYNYIDYTLGTLETSNVNYDMAKKLMTPGYRLQFKEDSFVPNSYCISDGPDKVRLGKTDSAVGRTTVRIEAEYGGEYVEMWDFELELFNNRWEIANIKCLL